MIDDNISMEEDTELRELVVQTLENNGVLAKVRAQLRASVFLTLEEQESVLNPEPFLNKSVKQYLSSSQGKILFSLVREFLEYFGLDYTISVFDPETYFGKEYNYVGRQKLCEEFGIDSKEPLLGELLKNTINSALINSQKSVNESRNNESQTPNQSTENAANATFDISVPTILPKGSISDCNDSSEKLESQSTSNIEMPINVTITKKQNDDSINKTTNSSVPTTSKPLPDEVNKNLQYHKEKEHLLENATNQNNTLEDQINSNTSHTTDNQPDILTGQAACQHKKSHTEFYSPNNLKNKKPVESVSKTGKTVFFDEIIVDGVKEKLTEPKDDKLLLNNLPPLPTSNNSIFGDLPPLNGKKANINDLKEMLDLAQGVSYNEKEFSSSASESVSEQSLHKGQFTSKSPETYINKQISVQSTQSDNESEDIDEEIPSNTSCLENSTENKAEKLIVINTKNHKE